MVGPFQPVFNHIRLLMSYGIKELRKSYILVVRVLPMPVEIKLVKHGSYDESLLLTLPMTNNVIINCFIFFSFST